MGGRNICPFERQWNKRYGSATREKKKWFTTSNKEVAVSEIVLIHALHTTLLQSRNSMFCSGHGENEGQAGMKGGGGANLRGGAGQEGEFMNTDLRIGKE